MDSVHWLLLGEVSLLALLGVAVVVVRYVYRYEDDLEYRDWNWRL